MSDLLLSPEVLSLVAGERVSRRDPEIEEIRSRELAEGVLWHRRRLHFFTEKDLRAERICINEVEVDRARARVEPVTATELEHLCDFPEIEDAYWATYWASGAIRGTRGLREPRLYASLAGVHRGDVPARVASALAHHPSGSLGVQEVEALKGRFSELRTRFVEGHNPTGRAEIVRWMPAVPPSRVVQSAAHVVAATSGGFYLNFPEEYEDGYSALHQPVGCLQRGGRLVSPPWIERPGFIEHGSGRVELAMLGPSSMRLTFTEFGRSLDLHRPGPEMPVEGTVLRSFDDRGAVGLPAGAVALVFSGARVVDCVPVERLGRVPIGGAAVVVTGDLARTLGDFQSLPAVKLEFLPGAGPVRWSLASGPILVNEGVVPQPDELLSPAWAGEFGPGLAPPLRFPYDATQTRAPRTALGLTEWGRWKMIVVDGRRPGEHSAGLTLLGLAHLCRILGCRWALNLDGGGSASMSLEGVGRQDALADHLAQGVVSFPSDANGRERILPTMMTAVAGDF